LISTVRLAVSLRLHMTCRQRLHELARYDDGVRGRALADHLLLDDLGTVGDRQVNRLAGLAARPCSPSAPPMGSTLPFSKETMFRARLAVE
jgi:hypothetical protein